MKFSIPFIAVLIIVIGCNFDEEVERSLEDTLLEISEKQNSTQEFTILSNRDTVIIGKLGTKIFFESNSFEKNGAELTEKEIEITLKEVYTNSETILNGLSTTSRGNLLETSGMINLEAKSGDQVLSLRKGVPLKIQFKKISDLGSMRTYLRSDDIKNNWALDTANIYDTIRIIKSTQIIVELAYGADSIINYQEEFGIVGNDTILLGSNKPEEAIYGDEVYDSTANNPLSGIGSLPNSQLPYYEINSTKLGWINCDYFIDSIDNIKILISPLDSLLPATTYLVFKEFNSIMSSWEFKENAQIFRNIPRDSEVTILSLVSDNNNLFYSLSNHRLDKEDEIIKIEYKETTAENLVKIIRTLD